MEATTQQQQAIRKQVEGAVANNPDLATYEVDGYGYDLYPADQPGLAVRFRYRRVDDEPIDTPGLEVTVFADDGSVIESQDFG